MFNYISSPILITGFDVAIIMGMWSSPLRGLSPTLCTSLIPLPDQQSGHDGLCYVRTSQKWAIHVLQTKVRNDITSVSAGFHVNVSLSSIRDHFVIQLTNFHEYYNTTEIEINWWPLSSVYPSEKYNCMYKPYCLVEHTSVNIPWGIVRDPVEWPLVSPSEFGEVLMVSDEVVFYCYINDVIGLTKSTAWVRRRRIVARKRRGVAYKRVSLRRPRFVPADQYFSYWNLAPPDPPDFSSKLNLVWGTWRDTLFRNLSKNILHTSIR